MMTNTEVDVDVLAAVWPVRGNRTIAEMMQREIELVGMPEWTRGRGRTGARSCRRKAKVPVEGLRARSRR